MRRNLTGIDVWSVFLSHAYPTLLHSPQKKIKSLWKEDCLILEGQIIVFFFLTARLYISKYTSQSIISVLLHVFVVFSDTDI
jgi:hypothetical protein